MFPSLASSNDPAKIPAEIANKNGIETYQKFKFT